ncbi:MAG: hypothetical protein GTO41_25615 [Burkholderiales bacterium]|nr:hypothetical protein [Burkholderiales bacterium]
MIIASCFGRALNQVAKRSFRRRVAGRNMEVTSMPYAKQPCARGLSGMIAGGSGQAGITMRLF